MTTSGREARRRTGPRLRFWAGVTAVLAAVLLALGFAIWLSGSPAVRGVHWVCSPAGMGCWALGILAASKHRTVARVLFALSAAFLMAGIVLLVEGW
jgi:hypothetical protein